MVRLTPIHASSDHWGTIPLAIGLFVSVSALAALCANHARRRRVPTTNYTGAAGEVNDSGPTTPTPVPPRSPLRLPKQLVTTISNKAITIIHHKRAEAGAEMGGGDEAEEGFGEGGLWQRTILMGEKCQPPEFPGVIYYDCCGKRISELPPRSPRASPLRSFSFPVPEDAN